MTHRINRRGVLKGITAGALSLTAVGPVSAGNETRYIVVVKGRGAHQRIKKEGFTIQQELAEGEVLGVVGSGDRADLEDVKGVKSVAEDYNIRWDGAELTENAETTDDKFFDLQWDKQVTDVPEAHDTATGDGTTLAIIDTGVDHDDHPDLPNVDAAEGRLFREGSVKSGTGTVEFPADVDDLCAGTTTIMDDLADDVLGHGTHVAGIAAASREGTTGVVGTAPDATIVPLRVFYWDEMKSDCDGDKEKETNAAALTTTLGDILTAIDYAASIDADAANMSLGTPPLPPQFNATGIRAAYQRVIESAVRRGTVVVASAGNSAEDLQRGGEFVVPAGVPGSLTVSATGPNDLRSFYSNYGTNVIDVGAPGGGYETLEKTFETKEEDDDDDVDEPDEPGVEWPFPTNLVLNATDPEGYLVKGPELPDNSQYAYFAGTSMAAPQVTGTVGLIRELHPDAEPKKVQQAIEQGAEGVNGKNDPDLGAGRLNANGALDALNRKGKGGNGP